MRIPIVIRISLARQLHRLDRSQGSVPKGNPLELDCLLHHVRHGQEHAIRPSVHKIHVPYRDSHLFAALPGSLRIDDVCLFRHPVHQHHISLRVSIALKSAPLRHLHLGVHSVDFLSRRIPFLQIIPLLLILYAKKIQVSAMIRKHLCDGTHPVLRGHSLRLLQPGHVRLHPGASPLL